MSILRATQSGRNVQGPPKQWQETACAVLSKSLQAEATEMTASCCFWTMCTCSNALILDVFDTKQIMQIEYLTEIVIMHLINVNTNIKHWSWIQCWMFNFIYKRQYLRIATKEQFVYLRAFASIQNHVASIVCPVRSLQRGSTGTTDRNTERNQRKTQENVEHSFHSVS